MLNNNIIYNIINFFIENPGRTALILLGISLPICLILFILKPDLFKSPNNDDISPTENNNNNINRERYNYYKNILDGIEEDLNEYFKDRDNETGEDYSFHPDRYIEKLDEVLRCSDNYEIRFRAKELRKKFRDYFYED